MHSYTEEELKQFDPTKPVQTRDERVARIICIDKKDPNFPIIALVQDLQDHSTELCFSYTAQGKFLLEKKNSPYDLINIRVKHKRKIWLNIHSDYVYVYTSKEEAEKNACSVYCIASIEREIEFEQGEGLEGKN